MRRCRLTKPITPSPPACYLFWNVARARIVINAFAHPQEVSYASIHGGPFPATSDSRFTSVGMTAIERFLRPVCYQGFPDDLLPEALKHNNPAGIWRLTEGELAKA